MPCSVEKQRQLRESARDEYKRLKDLVAQGYTEDADNGIYDIEVAMSAMKAIVNKKIEDVVEQGRPVDDMAINKLNSNRPRVGKSPVKVTRGVRYEDKVEYWVTYPNSTKEYRVDALRVSADQVNAKEVGLELGSREDIKVGKKVDWSKFDKMEVELHKDVNKAADMIDTLNEMDENALDKEEVEHLKELIGNMNPEFFKKMTMHINKKASTTGGIITGTKIAIMLSKPKDRKKFEQSAAEVYAHEIVHAYTMFAIEAAKEGDIKARKLVRELRSIMEGTIGKITEKDLVEGEYDKASKEEKDNAHEMFEYMFNNKNSKDEFIAHVLTNPQVRKALKGKKVKKKAKSESLIDIVKEWFSDLVKWMSGEYRFENKDATIVEAVENLAFRLAELNNRAVVKAKEGESLVSRLHDGFLEMDEKTSEKIKELADRLAGSNKSIGKEPDTPLGRAKWFAKFLGKAATDKTYQRLLGTYLDELGLVSVSGSVASIFRDFTDPDEIEKSIDWLQLQADKIDQSKMNVIAAVRDNVRDGFKGKLSRKEKEALTSVVVDTDLQSLKGKFSEYVINRVLTDEEYLDKKIGEVKGRLKDMDKGFANWHVNQAVGLGYYLATGKSHKAQNFNSSTIARGILGVEYKKPYIKTPGDLELEIDALASLVALKYTSKNEKRVVADLVKRDPKGVDNVMRVTSNMVEMSKSKLFKGQELYMIKGHSKELFDDMVSVEIGKVSDREVMESKGYELVVELEHDKAVSGADKYAIYKSSNHAVNNWHRSATRLTSTHRKGTRLRDVWKDENGEVNKVAYKKSKIKMDKERFDLVRDMYAGELNVEEIKYGMAPVIDSDGEVVDYRYMMSKDVKRDILNQDTRVDEVLGASRGLILDKTGSVAHNKNVKKLIEKDIEENYIKGSNIGKDGGKFVVIGPESEGELGEIWKVLPKELRKIAVDSDEGVLPIRKNMLHNYFGYREGSVTNLWGVENLPVVMKNWIKIAEVIWQEVIKIVKIDILIKMPFVIIGNIISNVVYAINTGSSITEIAEMYKESYRDVKEYLKLHREMVKLEELVNNGKNVSNNKKRIERIKKDLKDSPIHELYELGIYQAIVEDVSKEELSSTNKIKRRYNEAVEGAPKIVKDGMNWLYLTEETQYYKFMTETLQMSDLVARDIENRKAKKKNQQVLDGEKPIPKWYRDHLKETNDDMGRALKIKHLNHKNWKMSSEEKKYFKEVADGRRLYMVLNSFVNYNKVSGPTEEYLNKMGFVMFTKYAKRIQRIIGQTAIDYPLHSLGAVFSRELMGDLEMIQNQSVFSRSWYNMTPQSPIDRVLEIVTPALYQMPEHLS